MRSARGSATARALVVTPELSLCGYPPEDLVLRPAFLDACASELAALAARSEGRRRRIVGFPERDAAARYNAAAVLRDGRVARVYRKQHLPNYTVFDEERYFEPGDATRACSTSTAFAVGIVICEDCWFPEPARQSRAAGARARRRAERLAVPHAAAGRARRAGGRARTRDAACPSST